MPKNITLKRKFKLKLVEAFPEKLNINVPSNISIMEEKTMGYNESFIKILGQLKDLMLMKGEPFRAKAYQKAQETIMTFPENITNPGVQLKGLPGIGPTILAKLEEYMKTGTITVLEKEKNNPIYLFTQIHGIGPKKAQDLVNSNITTISQLRENPNVLNDVQKMGLKHFDDINKRIPRAEIDDFFIKLGIIFEELAPTGANFDIVGSYRRGLPDSGDIDVIITSTNNDSSTFNLVLDWLIQDGTIIEVLSRGKVKSLVIAKIYPDKKDSPARRVDFLYAPPDEYAFATLYFTGSMTFNTLMRQRALNLGYTLNEHGLSYMKDGVKGNKVEDEFPDEKSIFDFLGMKYKKPEERIDGRSIEVGDTPTPPPPEKKKESAEKVFEVGDTPTPPPPEKKKESAEKVFEVGDTSTPPPPEKKKESAEKVFEVGDTSTPLPPTSKKKNTTLKKLKIVSSADYIDKFKSEGIGALKMMTEQELNILIKDANNAYYCDDDPILTDNLYDILVEYTLEKYPKNTVAKEGHSGCDITVEKNKVKLPYELWSMDKIKPDGKAVSKWTNKYTGPYVISCKLDGISALYVSGEKASEAKLYTRGNGIYGQDITHLIPSIIWKNKSINDFETNFVIRGEIIIKKKVFEKKYANKFANPRNFVAGIVNKKTINPEILSDLDFVPYEVIKPELKTSEQMKFIRNEWISLPVKYTVDSQISNEILSNLLLMWREDYEYEIDGVIVVNDEIYPRPKKNPEYAFAFKMVISDQVVEAKVVDVLWTPSKDGYLKPRVRIKPIVLGGVTIEYATGFNAKFIKDNKIGVGALISIMRSGDVIPHIISVIIPAETAMMPPEGSYKWNESGVDIMLIDKDDDSVVREKNITGFFKGIGVDGLGSGNIKRIIDAGFDTVPKIISMTHGDFMKVEGFKDKLATKIFNGIKVKVDSASLVELMAASNIFGRGFGERRFSAILKVYPDILTLDISDKEKVKMLIKIDGLSGKTAEKFVEKIPQFVTFMNNAGLEGTLYNNEGHPHHTPDIANSGATELGELGDLPLQGKKIVMTGFRDKKLMEKIKAMGGEMGSSVSKNTFVVLVKDKDDDTGKADQARANNIPLMTPEEFTNEYL